MRHVPALSMLALVLTGTIANAQGATTTTKTKVKADDGKTVKMTGCMEIGGGTSFVLTNISSEGKQSREDDSVPRGGPYAVVARQGLDLSPYILQKVELTGVIVPAATTRNTQETIKIRETTTVDPKRGSDKTSTQSTTVTVPRNATPHLLVASVRTLAPGCQP